MSSEDDKFTTRRRILAASGSATMLGLAGCLGGDDTDDDGADNGDDTQPDGGDDDTGEQNGDEPTEETVTLLVEGVGDENGHDYHHDGLSESDVDHACSHMEFDEREPLEGGSSEDDAPVIDTTHQPYDVTFTGDTAYVKFEHDDDYDEISTFDIIDRSTEEVTADLHGDHWHGSLPVIEEGDNISLGADIEDEDGDEIELDGDHYEFRVALADDADEDVVSFDYHGDHVHIIGDDEGETEVVFQLYHDDHVEYETPSITAEVDHDHDNGHGDEDSEISEFEIIDRDHDEVTAYVHGDHWDGELPHIHEGEHISLGAYIEDDHGDEIELDGDHYELRVDHTDGADEDVVSFDYHGDHVHIVGEEEGEAEVVFQLYHDGHIEHETPAITAEVEHGHDNGDEDSEISEFEIIDRDADEVAAYVDGDHWHGSLPHIEEDEHISLGAQIEDDHGDEIELDGDHYELRVDHADGADENVVSFDYHGDHVHIIGEHEGETEVVFQLYHDGHTEYETPAITAEVDHDHDNGHGDDDAEMLSFFTEHGSASVVKGEEVYVETSEVQGCGPMDRYVVVEPDHGEAIVELSPDL